MNNKDNESWLSIIIPIVLIAIATHWLLDYNSKSERLKALVNEINSSKAH